ncbi:hypothetical protein HOLleu_05420 [Holothuria leucospilota]|uniref:Uncharacterized protein n=1 Tax=Holothuria leucospilota TaxID=206669 RepID=A0A9Q1HJ08_HOLLE|nr:hypothetical protein HOLleu_05420 [Holothuria leucospilota]
MANSFVKSDVEKSSSDNREFVISTSELAQIYTVFNESNPRLSGCKSDALTT